LDGDGDFTHERSSRTPQQAHGSLFKHLIQSIQYHCPQSQISLELAPLSQTYHCQVCERVAFSSTKLRLKAMEMKKEVIATKILGMGGFACAKLESPLDPTPRSLLPMQGIN